MGSWKIGKIKMEEMTDVDPEVYRRRAYEALCVGQYRTAIQETEKALKYGNNDIQDYVEIARILVKMQEYSQCLEFIRQHKIVDYFFTEEYRKVVGSVLSLFFKIYLECWKQVGSSLDEADVIIAVSDGTGMVKSLQDAIDMESQCHRIYFRNIDIDGVLGIIEKKDLCIIMDDKTLGRARTGKPFSKIIINSGNVRFNNSEFSLTEYSVGVEINGGNVLFENTKFKNIYRRDLAIGVYVKNQATVSMKNCVSDEDYDAIISLYAECGEINISHCRYRTIAVIGKNGKCSLNMLSCGGMGEQGVLVGYNTDSQLKNCSCNYITLEGKLQMDCQDNLVMNVYDTEVVGCIAAYNGGTMYLHNVGTKDNPGGSCGLEADNGKIFCENFLNNGYTVEIRQGMGKNTEIVCDFKYKIVNKLRNNLRMGAFLNRINWLTEN